MLKSYRDQKNEVDNINGKTAEKLMFFLHGCLCVRRVLSPLLANLCMHRFVPGWKKLGLERSIGSRIVTYRALHK